MKPDKCNKSQSFAMETVRSRQPDLFRKSFDLTFLKKKVSQSQVMTFTFPENKKKVKVMTTAGQN